MMVKWLKTLRPKQEEGPANLSIAAEAEEPVQQEIEGERGIPSVSRRRAAPAAVKWSGMAFAGLAVVVMLYAVNSPTPSEAIKAQEKKVTDREDVVENRLPPLNLSLAARKPITEPAPTVPNLASHPIPLATKGSKPVPEIGPANAGPQYGPNGERILSPEEQWKQRRRSGEIVSYESGSDIRAVSAAASSSAEDDDEDPGAPFLGPQMSSGQNNGLASKMRAVSTPGARAMRLSDRNFLLAKATAIDCTLESRLVSTVPGLIKCVSARDVYSDNGKVLLMEKGTTFTGTQQGGIRQGEARIFALWERAKTPKGVVIDLASPGADSLGGSGLEGYVDEHFWQRFGGAIMISMITDLTAPKDQQQQNYQATRSAGSEATSEALRSTINIPPTLYKNHGEIIMIFVSRDLDFKTVYALDASGSRQILKK